MFGIKLFEQSWVLMMAARVLLLLAITGAAWGRIEQNTINQFNRLAGLLLPEAVQFESAAAEPVWIEIDGKTVPVDVKRGLDASGRTVGWAFVCEGSGFADKIQLVVATDAAFETIADFACSAVTDAGLWR